VNAVIASLVKPARRDTRCASNVSRTFAVAAVAAVGGAEVFELATAEPVHVPPYNWRPGGSIEELTAEEAIDGGAYEGGSFGSLLSHLEMATPAALLLQLRFEDVRHEKFTYKARVNSDGVRGGVTIVDGSADGALTLKEASPESAFRWGCVVINWKTPAAMANENQVAAQVVIEMLAFAASTRRIGPVMFVATDLRHRMRVWQVKGRLFTEFRGADDAFLSVSEGFGVVCAQLPACIAACESLYRAAE